MRTRPGLLLPATPRGRPVGQPGSYICIYITIVSIACKFDSCHVAIHPAVCQSHNLWHLNASGTTPPHSVPHTQVCGEHPYLPWCDPFLRCLVRAAAPTVGISAGVEHHGIPIETILGRLGHPVCMVVGVDGRCTHNRR